MKVRAVEACFIDNRYREVGAVFDYDGPTPPKGVGPIVPAPDEEGAPQKKSKQRGAQAGSATE